MGIAVDTFQVACPGHVPDHHWLLIRRELKQMRRQIFRKPSVTERIRGLYSPTIEFGDTYHFLVPAGFGSGKNSSKIRLLRGGPDLTNSFCSPDDGDHILAGSTS
jgi:hypothetical protein